MLDPKTIRRIEEFVAAQPRSVSEVARHVNRNWRTADRYLEAIKEEFGTIATKTFRGGTRGALKIAYWAGVEQLKGTVFQEGLARQAELFKRKEDFSPLDIYQHVAPGKRRARVARRESAGRAVESLANLLRQARQQLLCYSGNLSWLNLQSRETRIHDVVEELVERGVTIKVLCRVDLAGYRTIERLLSLNARAGKDVVEARHREQPIRALIIDGRLASLKEVKEPTGKRGELEERLTIYYEISEKEWISWLEKLFWRLFSRSPDARQRLATLQELS